MRSNFEFLKKLILCPDLTEAEFKKILAEVSSHFTSEREKIKKYVFSREMISSYALFFIPTNYPKFFFLMNQIEQNIQEDIKKCDFIDVGTGPGTYLLSFLDFLGGKVSLDQQFLGIDSSHLMLEQAKKVIEGIYPELGKSLSLKIENDQMSLRHSKKILFFGHSLNEMGIDKAIHWVEKVDPEYLCFIEPGTPQTFDLILKIRKRMSDKGYDSLYPCPSLSLSCPMEEESGKGDWCHQVLRMTHDPLVERMCQLVSKNRRVMPLIGHLYKKGKKEKISKPFWREGILVRLLKETKFSFQWIVCLLEEKGPSVNKHVLVKIDVLKKFISKRDIKTLKKISIGERFYFEIVKEISQKFWQVELKELEDLIVKIPSKR
jgi:hypothetical protein